MTLFIIVLTSELRQHGVRNWCRHWRLVTRKQSRWLWHHILIFTWNWWVLRSVIIRFNPGEFTTRAAIFYKFFSSMNLIIRTFSEQGCDDWGWKYNTCDKHYHTEKCVVAACTPHFYVSISCSLGWIGQRKEGGWDLRYQENRFPVLDGQYHHPVLVM